MGSQARGVDLDSVLQAIQVNRYSEGLGEVRVDEGGPGEIPSGLNGHRQPGVFATEL